MTRHAILSNQTVAISISESEDMPILGFAKEHLDDAMTEVARHMMVQGARLAYGGDLRSGGFTELLIELTARHSKHRESVEIQPTVVNFLAWPVHRSSSSLWGEQIVEEMKYRFDFVYLDLDGGVISRDFRRGATTAPPTDAEWSSGLTNMRKTMASNSNARVVLGGRTSGFKGRMPGIAEEALISMELGQPLFVLGGFGGCASDICTILGLSSRSFSTERAWPGRDELSKFTDLNLRNGLSRSENEILARTPHIDQAIALMIRGFKNLGLREIPHRSTE